MAYTTIDDPSAYFQVAAYSNNGSTITVTNDGNSDLKPDLIWNKQRTNGGYHGLWDSSRGISRSLSSNVNGSEQLSSGKGITAFNTDGFTGVEGSWAEFNQGSQTSVAWQWKVNGGTTTSLSANINSVCQVNQDAGISIVKYTCTGGGNGQSVQHGLGLVPQVIITKNRTDASYSDWITYHHSFGYANFVKLNSTAASATNSPYNQIAPTSSTYNVSIDLVEATKDYVSYVFAPIQGYSKFGSYVGNGNGANGPFVYTGFKPAFVMIKVTSAVESWVMFDGKRKPVNRDDNVASIYANTNGAEYTGASYHNLDILSNGFKVLLTNTAVNASGASYIYMAFAENPFVTSTGVPTTAR